MVKLTYRGVSDRDAMILTPFELWKKYRIIPLEAALHVVGFLFVLVLVVFVNSQLSTYYRFNEKTFAELFAPDTEEIVLLETLLARFNETVSNYYYVNQITVQNFQYLSSPPPPIRLMVKHKNLTISYYNLTLENPYGPLNGLSRENIATYLDQLELLRQSFTLISVDADDPDGNPEKTWDVSVFFDYSTGIMTESLRVDQRRHVRSTQVSGPAIAVLTVIISILSFSFSLYRVVLGLQIRQRTKARFESIPPSALRARFKAMGITPPPMRWGDLPIRVRMDFFSLWNMYSLVGDGCVIASCIMSLTPYLGIPSLDYERLAFGIGVLIVTSRLTSYLEIFPGLYTLIYTLKLCAAKIIKYILSIAPLFLGFLFCADILFGPYSSNFSSSGVTGVTLFALLNGDDIHGVFQDLDARYPYGPWVSRTYLFIFILFWINAILNVCIFIIEDSFHLAKLLSAKYRMSDEELPGTYQIRYQAEWSALQHGLDMAKLFLVLDKEAPIVVDSQHLRLLVSEDSEVQGDLLDDTKVQDLESDLLSSEGGHENDVIALLEKQHAQFMQRVEDLRKEYLDEVREILKSSRK